MPPLRRRGLAGLHVVRSRPRRRLVLSVLACTVLLAALAGAYTYDTSQHLDAVARNVELDGSLIGGAEGDQTTCR